MVILYSQQGCPQCQMIHRLLDQKKIEYNECQDINKMTSLEINHTPALQVDDKIIYGKDIFQFINKGEIK